MLSRLRFATATMFHHEVPGVEPAAEHACLEGRPKGRPMFDFPPALWQSKC